MSPSNLVSRVLDGEDPFDVVREVTKTHMIAKYPLPMGMVKKTRRKKQGDEPTYESLLEQAATWLLERKRAKPLIMYHGTSSKFLREILKKGLVPNPRMRVWNQDKAAQRSVSQATRRSLDAVYFTSNFTTAVQAAGAASRKFVGDNLYVAAQIQPRSAYADEDTLNINLEKAIRSTIGSGYTSDPSIPWFEATGKDLWKQWGWEVAKKLADNLSRSELPFGLGQKASKVPLDPDACIDVVRGYIEQAVAIRYKEEGDKWLRSHMFRTEWKGSDFDATDEEKQQVLNRLKQKLPMYKEAEDLYLKGLNKLTKRYKDLALLGKGGGGFSAEFSHSLRVPETVNYRGRNKILAVFTTRYVPATKTGYVIVHYGTVTPKIISGMRQSNWFSGREVKVITPAEARKLGV